MIAHLGLRDPCDPKGGVWQHQHLLRPVVPHDQGFLTPLVYQITVLTMCFN